MINSFLCIMTLQPIYSSVTWHDELFIPQYHDMMTYLSLWSWHDDLFILSIMTWGPFYPSVSWHDDLFIPQYHAMMTNLSLCIMTRWPIYPSSPGSSVSQRSAPGPVWPWPLHGVGLCQHCRSTMRVSFIYYTHYLGKFIMAYLNFISQRKSGNFSDRNLKKN